MKDQLPRAHQHDFRYMSRANPRSPRLAVPGTRLLEAEMALAATAPQLPGGSLNGTLFTLLG
ncbi:MAG TPA: hypothetical protein VE888_10110 [Streptosporangiaceae bacterium]|nr:hypothetical protein [Streptosporangiaceae bacterium]